MLAKEFMSRTLYLIGENSKLSDAIKLTAEKKVGRILVLKNGKPVSMFTERDLIQKILAKGLGANTEIVGRHASGPLKFADTNMTEKEILAFMLRENVRRVPILESANVIGIVTCIDLLKAIAAPNMKMKNEEIR